MTHHDLTDDARACPHCKREIDLGVMQAQLFFRDQKEAAPLSLTVHEDSSFTADTLADAHPIEEPDPGPELTILVTFVCPVCHEPSFLEVDLWRP